MSQKTQGVPTKADFDLHVLMLMRTKGLTKSKALFEAWLSGPRGVDALMPRVSEPDAPPAPAK